MTELETTILAILQETPGKKFTTAQISAAIEARTGETIPPKNLKLSNLAFEGLVKRDKSNEEVLVERLVPVYYSV